MSILLIIFVFMSEIDIWIGALEIIGYKFIDEHCGRGSQNKLIYHYRVSPISDTTELTIWFDRKFGRVDLVMFSDNLSWGKSSVKLRKTKDDFEEEYRDVFRDVKLKSFTNE